MINHISIGVNDPKHIADVIAELWGGIAYPFPPSPGGYIVFADDDKGSAIELVPLDVHMMPGEGLPAEENFSIDTPTEEFEATFVEGNASSLFGSVHVNINSPLNEAEIKAIAEREGWRCFTANRAGGLFQLIEIWVENRLLVEVNTPAMTEIYRNITKPELWAEFLQGPMPPNFAANYAAAIGAA
ncbi:MAG: hypothetical protein UZ17_ACD001001385 [Acidobacteria bacterium OLB17]|nr:MAG: hypothetical protein UZ17_ACD001001385 [Acidobacteria bacterium OLB17]MCZ2391770.1 hypothetical protein [Acidobacteriota bacterium]